jgi:hypothetical protein
MSPLFLLIGLAFAKDDGILRPEGTDCAENAVPIAGTSGFENARDALRTTAQTYSATSFAERRLFSAQPSAEGEGGFSMEFFQMFGAAHVPSVEAEAKGDTNCPADFRVSTRPVDLQAMAMGFHFQKGHFGGFYAASVAYGNTAMPNNIVRGMLTFAQPMYAGSVLAFAPLARNGWQTQTGASAFAMDWVAGVSFTSELLGARVGYAGSRGLYANLVENKLGLFASGVFGGQDEGLLGFFRGGIDRAPLHKLAKGAGMTSLYWRDLPYGLTPSATTPDAGGLLPENGRLKTIHFEQLNLGRQFDLAGAWATAPDSTLHHLLLGFHTPGFHEGRLADAEQTGPRFLLRGGLASVPGQAMLGLEGGRYASLRAEAGAAGKIDDALFVGSWAFLLNDPELLALYPYAVNALTVRMYLDVQF